MANLVQYDLERDIKKALEHLEAGPMTDETEAQMEQLRRALDERMGVKAMLEEIGAPEAMGGGSTAAYAEEVEADRARWREAFGQMESEVSRLRMALKHIIDAPPHVRSEELKRRARAALASSHLFEASGK